MKLKQIYHNYNFWEDYTNGMWKKINKETEKDSINAAIEFMNDTKLFSEAMFGVVDNWHYTCEQNLTDNMIYHRAFIGQCAVCYALGLPEYITREAWGHLTLEKQFLANKEASKAIKKWKLKQSKKQQNYVNKELFG
jgi:hypothetical protein